MKATFGNAVRGLWFGVFMATAFTGWVTILRFANGDTPFERTGTPFWTTVLFYYAGFSVGGLTAGSLWSLLHRWAVGWAIMGVVFVTPMYVLFGVFNSPASERWSALKIGATIFGASIVGVMSGLRVWSLERYGEREPETNWRFVAGMIVVGGALAVVMYLAWW